MIITPPLRTAIVTSQAVAKQAETLTQAAANIKAPPAADDDQLQKKALALLGNNATQPALAGKQLEELIYGARQEKRGLHTVGWAVHDQVKTAAKAYERLLPETHVVYARVYGPELGATLQSWYAAKDIVKAAAAVTDNLKVFTPENFIDEGVAQPFLQALEKPVRQFVRDYDAMLVGTKAVSDVFAHAEIFKQYPQLQGKDLPSLFDALATVVESASAQELKPLFHPRWIEGDSARKPAGKLPGDLDEVVDRLRADAQAIREGAVFAPSNGWAGSRHVDTSSYVRADSDDDRSIPAEVHLGLIPELLWALTSPNINRSKLEFATPPTFGDNKAQASISMSLGSDGTLRIGTD